MVQAVQSTIQFPYKRSLGPVVGAFMTALTERRIIGIRSGDRVHRPAARVGSRHRRRAGPRLRRRGARGDRGVVVVGRRPHGPAPARPPLRLRAGAARRRRHDPAARGRRRLDRRHEHRHAGGPAVAGGTHRPHHRHRGVRARRGAGGTGRRRRPRRGAGHDDGLQRVHHLLAAGHAQRAARRAGQRRGPLPRPAVPRVRPHATRAARATARSTRSSSTTEHELDLPQHGTVTNYTIITPVQYPGQTETEPFARVHVLLDGTDVILGYQPLLDTPDDDVRIGMRVAAVWASDSGEGRPRQPDRRGQPPRLDAHRRARRRRPRAS